jgi:putative colanic acid biosynthesis acetyltransferase WcaF
MCAFRFTPVPLHQFRTLVLTCFGAKISGRFYVYPSTRIWAPWNLTAEDGSCLGPWVDCYNVAPIYLARKALVSQYAYLCTASHDYRDPGFALIVGEIRLEEGCWVAARSFVGPGVTIGAGAVVGAQSVVTRPVGAHEVVAGAPARKISDLGRVLAEQR